MDIRENLELIEVNYENDNKKAILVFLDAERGEIREVNFNLQSYKEGKFFDDPDKAEKVEGWCRDFFGVAFSTLPNAIGAKKTVYCYDTFNSLFEVEQIERFTPSMKGKLYQTNIENVVMDDVAIRIRYKIDGKVYESKMTFGKYVESMNAWFPDPVKRKKTLEKFIDRFGCPIEEADKLVGAKLIVEVKAAFGDKLYGDVKKLPQ